MRLALFLYALTTGLAYACEATGIALEEETGAAPNLYMALDEIRPSAPFSVRFSFCGDGPINELAIDATMPLHQHGMNYEPRVVALSGTEFLVENMVFHMPGQWELRLDAMIEGLPVSYSYAITVQ